MNGGSLSGNSAARVGGGSEANGGSTMLQRVTLSANATGPAPGNGGGLQLTGTGEVTVLNSTVASNTATAEGGGLWNSATGTMTVTDAATANNTTPVGPNVLDDGGTFTIDGVPVPVGP